MPILDILGIILGIAETAIGAAGVDNKNIQKYLSTARFLLAQGEAAREDLQALADQMQVMVDEDRDPTEAEWDALRARSNAAFDAIAAWQDPEEN